MHTVQSSLCQSPGVTHASAAGQWQKLSTTFQCGQGTTSKTSLLDTFFFVPVQSLGEWSGDAQVTVAGQWLEPGKYMLQLALDPARCQCEIGQHGSLPFDVSWRLQLLPTAEAKACPIVADDSKQKYSLVRNSAHSHTAPAGIASHHACSRYMHCDSDSCAFFVGGLLSLLPA